MIFLEGAVTDTNAGPVAGVNLSNGELIVTTDGSGTYAIEAQPGKHRFLALSVPRTHRRAAAWFRRIDAAGRRSAHRYLPY